jgi:hypothetical protein
MFNPNTSEVVRLDRQARMRTWIVARWGDSAMAPAERAERLFEEACELMQAEGRSIERAMKIAAVVYSKPAGDPAQEVAGVQTCALAYCASRGLSADTVERVELERIEGLSIEHFRERHARKVAEGLALDVDAETPTAAPEPAVYRAEGGYVWKEPVRRKLPEGGESVTIGFRVCRMMPEVGDEAAETVAALMNLGETAQTSQHAPPPDLDRVARALEAAANVANPSRARTYRNLVEVMRKPGFHGAAS